MRRLTYKVAEKKTIIESKTGIIESKNLFARFGEIDHCLSNRVSDFHGIFRRMSSQGSKVGVYTHHLIVRSASQGDHPGTQAEL